MDSVGFGFTSVELVVLGLLGGLGFGILIGSYFEKSYRMYEHATGAVEGFLSEHFKNSKHKCEECFQNALKKNPDV